MDENDKKVNGGAPSSDTTSALFVSARKKQLEQQEAERRAKEKEEQRLAAEAEVRRLEREVEERRRKAEEDARQAEEDARRFEAETAEKKRQAEARRIAGEAREENAQAPAGQAPALGAAAPPPKEHRPLQSKKLMAMIGGGGVLALALVVGLIALGGGKPAKTPAKPVRTAASRKTTEAPADIPVEISWDPVGVFLWDGDYEKGVLMMFDDQSFELESPEGTIEGTWYLEGGTVYLEAETGETDCLVFSDADTLYSSEGSCYSRTDELTAELPDTPELVDVDPDITLDALAEITAIYEGVRYPSGVLELVELTDTSVQFESIDSDAAVLLFGAGDQGNTDSMDAASRVAAMNSQGMAYADAIASGAESAVTVSELAAEIGEGLYRYQRVMDLTIEGSAYRAVTYTTLWNVGRETGEKYYHHALLLVKAEVADSYTELFLNMVAARVDT